MLLCILPECHRSKLPTECDEMKRKALAICPSRQRVEMCRIMCSSFLETRHDTDLVLVIDEDDPQYSEYLDLCFSNPILYYVNNKSINMTYTQMLNHQYLSYPHYEYYHITNDDFVYFTDGWDRRFIQVLRDYGSGVAYGNDLYMGRNLPTAPFISAEVVRALGWVQLPTLTHLCGDMVWKVIGEGLESIYYLKDVIIEHKHPLVNKAPKDVIFEKTNSKEMYSNDNAAFRHWVLNDSHDDIERIKKYGADLEV